MLASGVAVANSLSANPRGESFEEAKFIEEKLVLPDVTSGTLDWGVLAPREERAERWNVRGF